ncbi:MAG: DUF4302 domain-containing protein [Adhaeribacter sp.]
MKRIFHLGLLLVLLLSACDNKDEIAPGERPDERLNQTLSDYKNQLVGAENGWKAILYPAGGAAYSFFIKFNANDRLSMVSDINANTAATPLESTYRLKAMQQPALIFDTYNYMHILADPDPRQSNGDVGAGKYSDFEFSFESVTPETITLKGTLQGSRLVLTKATKDVADNFISRIAERVKTFESINNFTTYFKRLIIANQTFDFSANTNLRQITITYSEGGATKSFTTEYYYTEAGIEFLTPFAVGSTNITGLSSMQYNASNKTIQFTVNNVAGTIRESTSPAAVDLQAARRFYNNPPNGLYWVNFTGFTVEGVEDAFGVNNIDGFEIITFYKQPDPPYDGFIFWTADDFFGPAIRTQFRNDGRIVFAYDGAEFGTPPAAAEAIVDATRAQLIIPEGYYVIQVGPNSYDLVSAKDAKTWISF